MATCVNDYQHKTVIIKLGDIMIKYLTKALILSLICIFTLPALTFAAMQHSIGVDMIRTVDQAQYDALFNINYQGSLNLKTAIVASISADDDYTIGDLGFKYYFEKYFDGPFAQVGVNVGDYDGDTEFGVSASLGYEKSIVRHLVIGCAVEMIAGTMDNYATGDRDPIFRPILNVIFAF